MTLFLSGAAVMGYAVAGLFFLRFWRRTGDRLFAAFAAAFWLLGVQRTLVAMSERPAEEVAALYLLRLAAFVVIIVAILDRNRRA